LDPHIGKWSTQTLREVKTPEPSSKPWINETEFDHREWRSERLCRFKWGLSDERMNNDFSPIRSSGGWHYMQECSRASNYIRCYISFHQNSRIGVYQYQFWISNSKISIGVRDFKSTNNKLRGIQS
jgi:hypothetical protein